MHPLFAVLAAILKAWMRLMGWRVETVGEEHLPRRGAAVIASNHVGYLDPVQIGWVVQRHGRVPRFLAKRELFAKPVLGWVMRTLRQVPVDRRGTPGASLPPAEERLRAGDWVVVFCEGTISTSFVPATPRLGAARLALATGAPLVPVALWGSHRILTKGRPRNLQRGVVWSVRIGAPLTPALGEDAAQLTCRLWTQVRRLVDEAQTAYPQQPSAADDRWWQPRHLGGTAPAVAPQLRQLAPSRAARQDGWGTRRGCP